MACRKPYTFAAVIQAVIELDVIVHSLPPMVCDSVSPLSVIRLPARLNGLKPIPWKFKVR